jgi:hypothetical protein
MALPEIDSNIPNERLCAIIRDITPALGKHLAQLRPAVECDNADCIGDDTHCWDCTNEVATEAHNNAIESVLRNREIVLGMLRDGLAERNFHDEESLTVHRWCVLPRAYSESNFVFRLWLHGEIGYKEFVVTSDDAHSLVKEAWFEVCHQLKEKAK